VGAQPEKRTALQTLLALVVGLVVLAVTATLILLLIRGISRLDSEVATAVIAAAATVVVSVVTVTLGRYFERKRQIESDTRLRKIPLYEGFLGLWFRVLYQDRMGDERLTDQDMFRAFADFTKAATVWAPDDVILKWRDVRSRYAALAETGGVANKAAARERLFLFEELLLAIRRDTGYPNTNLKRGDLLGLFVDNIEQHL
jgi:hypothetical protein